MTRVTITATFVIELPETGQARAIGQVHHNIKVAGVCPGVSEPSLAHRSDGLTALNDDWLNDRLTAKGITTLAALAEYSPRSLTNQVGLDAEAIQTVMRVLAEHKLRLQPNGTS